MRLVIDPERDSGTEGDRRCAPSKLFARRRANFIRWECARWMRRTSSNWNCQQTRWYTSIVETTQSRKKETKQNG